MTFKVLLDQRACENIKKFDRTVNLYIRSWLRKNLEGCDNPRLLGKEPKGQSMGVWRYRIGDYRVCAQIRDSESVILVVAIRHRSKAYGN